MSGLAREQHRRHVDSAAPQLTVELREQGTTTVVSVGGEWDLSTREVLPACRGALEHGPERLVLDLSHLEFIDASGLHAIVALHRHCNERDVQLVIIRGPRAVHRLFEILELTAVLPFVEVAR